jgi:hypothetical protein
MTGWVWLVAGIGALVLLVSIIVSLVIAAILGQIGRDVSDLLESAPSAFADADADAGAEESESWASAPLAREATAKKRRVPTEGESPTRAAAPKTRIL